MEAPQNVESLFVFEAGSINTIIKDNHGTIYTNRSGESVGEKSKEPLTMEMLKVKVDSIRDRIDKDRYWFPVCKFMMWEGLVAEGDFTAAKDVIQRLFDVQINAKDLSVNLNVMSFRKVLAEWDINDAPVAGSTFHKYKSIADALYSA